MVLFGVIELAEKLLQHVLGVLLLCWQRMLRFGLSVGVLSFLVAEVLGAALTRHFPPSILTTVVALIVSFALGYAAALTALADELLISAVDTVKLLEGDAKAGIRAATVAAEREAGEARMGLLGWLGHPPAPKTVAALTVAGVSDQPATAMPAAVNETLADVAATELFQSSAARYRVNARPVRADQLPRIPWAYDQEGGSAPAPAEALATADMPPLPLRVPDAAPLAAPTETLATTDESATAEDDPAATLPAARKPVASAPAADPAATEATPETPDSPAAPALPAAPTSPAAPAEPAPDASGDRSIWARIGQALVGNTMPLAALGGTNGATSPSNRPAGRASDGREDTTGRDEASGGRQSGQRDEA